MAQADLIRILSDGQLHSGQALATQLGLSRTAVWKQLQRLQSDWGLVIHSQPGRGYQLPQPIELLDAAEILRGIHPSQHSRLKLELHDRLASTNAHLLERLQRGERGPRVCLAEYQSAGQGRRGRNWQSPFGTNLYCSLLWHSPLPPARLGALSLVMGVAVAGALRAKGCTQIGLKWPNDLISPQGKLGGILIQLQAEAQGHSDLVIGLGLNLHMPDAAGAYIDQQWTDLGRLGYHFARSQLAGELIQAQLEALQRFEVHGLDAFLPQWRQLDLWWGREVRLQQESGSLSGRYLGIDTQGQLLLEINGMKKTFHSGEVSLCES